MAKVYPFIEILMLSRGCTADATCWRDEIHDHTKFRSCAKVLSKIQTNFGRKYNLENSYSTTVQKIKNWPVNVGIGKARKRGVLAISHRAE
jgi:hypothetical protein